MTMGSWIADFLSRPLVRFSVTAEQKRGGIPADRPLEGPMGEHALAPRTLAEFVGQHDAVRLLQVEVDAWRAGHRVLPLNVLAYGPPGTGKTSMAYCLANELGLSLFLTVCSEFRDQRDVLRAFSDIGERERSAPNGTLWLLDEIDGAENRRALYPIYSLLSSRVVHYGGARYGLGRPLVVVATCNRPGSVEAAVRSRFTMIPFDYYGEQDLETTASATARKMGFDLTPEAAQFVARSSAGEPRKGLHILRVVSNLVRGGPSADLATAQKALELSGLHAGGLTVAQVKILRYLSQGPAGLNSLAAITGLPGEDIQVGEEAFLVRSGYVRIGGKGRFLTQKGTYYVQREAA
jgi:Holliday junction DNA helicase RuvB